MNNTPDTSEPLAASILFVLVFAFMGSLPLVAKQNNEFVNATNSIHKGRQGAFGNRMLNVLLSDVQKTEQMTDLCFRPTSIPWRKNHNVNHAQVVNIEHHEVGEGGINIPRLAVMGVERVIEPEQGANKLVASQTNLVPPANTPSANRAEDRASNATDNGGEDLVTHRVMVGICMVIILLASAYAISEWRFDRELRKGYVEFFHHMRLPIDRSRHSDGSVNVHYGRTSKDQIHEDKR